MSSESLKSLIAQQAAAGYTATQLAKLHSYSYEGMRRLLADDEMREAVAREQEIYQSAGARAMFRWLMHADQLSQAQLEDALNPASKNQYAARTYILDRILPQRKAGESGELNVNLAIRQEVAVGLTTALEGASRALDSGPIGNVRLIAGKEALPKLTGTE